MSLLVVKLPPRERLGARGTAPEAAAGLRPPSLWEFMFSADGKQPGPLRQAAAALLPKAGQLVLVLAPADVSWHRLLVPKAGPARMAAALAGMLEERLLDDEASVHLALAADAVPGQQGWVAATHRQRLAAALAVLEAAGHTVERVVTSMPPPGPALRGHFALTDMDSADRRAELDLRARPASGDNPSTLQATGEPSLCLSRENGVWCLPLASPSDSGLAEALRTSWAQEGSGQRWTTTPAAALVAERFLGRPVALQTESEHLLEAALAAAAGGLNLRQFELTSRHRGMRAVGSLGKRLLSAEWRWARWGLLVLAALQLVGLNAYAWQQRHAVQNRRAVINDILRTTHPGVRTVLDAPAQMAGETDRLRAAAGRPGGADLEMALSAAASVWPERKGPVGNLRYEPGRLTLAAPGWAPAEVNSLSEQLRPAGWTVELAEGRLTLTRARAPGGAP